MNSNLAGMNAVLDRMSAVQSRFSTSGGTGRVMGSQSSGASFDSTLDALSGGSGDGLDASMLSTQMFRALTTAGSGTDSAPTTTGSDAVDAAKKYLGVPYVWGGTDPATGLDCSGLVQRAFADLGMSVPRTSGEQAQIGTPVASLADARPGDLVAFGQPVNHIGIYAGNGQMVVAPHRGDVVKVQDITAPIVAIRRVLPDGAATTATSSAATTAVTAPAIASLLKIDGNTTVAQLLASVLSTGGSGSSGLAASGIAASGIGTTGTATTTDASAAPYAELFRAAGAKYGIDPEILAAVARAESAMNPAAVSSAGAQGLMQLMPATAAGLGVDPMQPAQAIDGAARLLSSHLEQFGSLDLALAAYNAGPGAVRRYDGIPPYAETQGYVRKILADLGATPSAIAAFASATSTGSPASTGAAAADEAGIARFTSPTTTTTTTTPAATTATTTPAATTPATTTTPAVTSTVTTGPVITYPDPSSPVTKPTAGAWGPNTQMQVSSQGGTNGTTWAALGYLEPAGGAAVTASVPKAKGPVALGVLRILQNATPAQLASKEFRQTLNDVNRDALGDPSAPDVIEVDPAKDPTPVANANPNTGAAAAKPSTTAPATAAPATTAPATPAAAATAAPAATTAPTAAAAPAIARVIPAAAAVLATA